MVEKGFKPRPFGSYELTNVRILQKYFEKCIQDLPKGKFTFPEIIVALHSAVDNTALKTLRDLNET